MRELRVPPEVRRVMPAGSFPLDHYDPVRKLLTIGRFNSEGVIETGYIQFTPDNMSDQNRHMGQQWGSLIGNTQDHYRPIWRVPDALTNQWHLEDKHLDEDDRQKKMRQRMNDSQYRDLRITTGKV